MYRMKCLSVEQIARSTGHYVLIIDEARESFYGADHTQAMSNSRAFLCAKQSSQLAWVILQDMRGKR